MWPRMEEVKSGPLVLRREVSVPWRICRCAGEALAARFAGDRFQTQLTGDTLNEIVFHGDERVLVVPNLGQPIPFERLETELHRGLAQRCPRLVLIDVVGGNIPGSKIEHFHVRTHIWRSGGPAANRC